MSTVVQETQRSNADRHQRWARLERAALFEQSSDLYAHRPANMAPCLAQVTQAVNAARQEHQRRAAPREPVTQSIRAIGHAYHCGDVERGVCRNGKLIAGDIQRHLDPIRTIAQHAHLSQVCLERIEKAARVVPKMQATIECGAGYVRQQVRQLNGAPPVSYAMHAPRIPSYYLERVAATRTAAQGAPLRALAERLRTSLFAPAGVLGAFSPAAQNRLQDEAAKLAEVVQRSSSNGEGRNGYLSLRNPQLRGLDHPRKRECLPAVPHFLLTRPDGTTAAE